MSNSDHAVQLSAQSAVIVTVYDVTTAGSIDVVIKGQSTQLIPHLTRLVTDALTPDEAA
jgi:hypothetical protein